MRVRDVRSTKKHIDKTHGNTDTHESTHTQGLKGLFTTHAAMLTRLPGMTDLQTAGCTTARFQKE